MNTFLPNSPQDFSPNEEPPLSVLARIRGMLLRRSKHFICEEEAATTVEYALLIALIIVFSVSAVLNTGEAQDALWFNTADTLEATIGQN